MSLKFVATAAAACFVFAGTTAYAGDWGEKIEMCADAAEAEGLVDLSRYEAEFDGGNSRRMSVVFYPIAQGDAGEDDVIEVECKIARGRVVSVDPQ